MPTERYTLETLVEITSADRQLLAAYREHGLIVPVSEDAEPHFDDDALHQIRRLEFLRAAYGANVEGLRAICQLLERIETLEAEVRFLRARL